jgi:hypothetical protein
MGIARSRNLPDIPLEIQERCIEYAWVHDRENRIRLYYVVSLVSRAWRTFIKALARRHVFCTTWDEYELYLRLLLQADDQLLCPIIVKVCGEEEYKERIAPFALASMRDRQIWWSPARVNDLLDSIQDLGVQMDQSLFQREDGSDECARSNAATCLRTRTRDGESFDSRRSSNGGVTPDGH